MTSDTSQASSDSTVARAIKTDTPDLIAPWWLSNGHAQTLYRKFSNPELVIHTRQRIELADGDFIDLDWARRPESAQSGDGDIVVILHGLCGCSQSSYVLALQSQLNKMGKASVAMNFRGCSGQSNRLARTYHSGASEDLRAVMQALSDEFPNSSISAVGYSLGANVLLKYLGEEGDAARCVAAVAVSTPFQLAHCSRAMLKGASSLYGRYFVNRLTSSLQAKLQQLELAGADQELQRLRALQIPERFTNIWQFDDLVTAPLHGFADAADYYERCSSAGFIGRIRTPTLLLQSGDDPIIPAMALPDPEELPAEVEFRLTDKGGHVGFISARHRNWLEERITGSLFATS